MKRISLFIIIILFSGCKKTTTPDSPPYFVSGIPIEEVTNTNIGNSHTVRGTAKDPDGDDFDYKTLKDGVQVNDSNEYTFTIDKKGMTRIDVVAYNALSDTLTKYFSAENQAPNVENFSSEINEGKRGAKAISDLANDPDGDNLTPAITSTTGLNAYFTSDSLIYTAIADFVGNGTVKYSFTDGDLTATGTGTINVKAVKPTLNDLADVVKNEDEPIVGSTEATLNVSDPNNDLSELTYEITQTNPDLIRLGFNTEKTGLVLENLKKDGYGTSDITVKISDPQGNSVEKSFRYTLNPMDDFKGYLKNISTGAKEPGVIKVGGVLFETDSQGNFEFQVSPITNHILKAQGYNANGKTTTIRQRTTTGNQDLTDLIVKVSPILPTSTGVSEDTFYNFANQANFSSWYAKGLKKIDFENAQHPDSTWMYWISKTNPKNGDEFTTQEQNEIKQKIIDLVLASIPENMRPSIYIATAEDEIPKAPESLWRPNKYGYCIIYPRRNVNPGIGTLDENKDGIIEKATIFLPNSTHGIVQEPMSRLYAPNQVDDYIPPNKTVLHTNTSQTEKQPADYLLESIALNYKELTSIDEILGKGELK